MDPPIDNADPVEEAHAALKDGLRQLAFPLMGSPSHEFVRVLAGAALSRIRELEFVVKVMQQAVAPSCAKCRGEGSILGPSDSGYIDCPACHGRGA